MTGKRATGCPRLGNAIREICEIRQVTLTELAGSIKASWDGGWTNPKAPTRAQLSQYANGHRSMYPVTLQHIEAALDADFAGVNRQAYSAHHYRVCRADKSPLVVTDRSTGNELYSDAVTGRSPSPPGPPVTRRPARSAAKGKQKRA